MRLGPRGVGPGRGLGAPALAPQWTFANLAGQIVRYHASNVTMSDATHVSTLLDASGNGYHANAGALLTNQGIIAVDSGANGHTAVSHDGNDNYSTVGLVVPTTDGLFTTLYWIGSFGTLTSPECAVSLSSTGNVRLSQSVAGVVSGSCRVEVWDAAAAFCTGSTVANTSTMCIVVTSPTGNHPGQRLWVNGVAVPLTPADTGTVSPPAGPLYVGSTSAGTYYRGLFHEMAFVTGQATDAQAAQAAAYSRRIYHTP